MQTTLGLEIAAFRGIPYAEPPLGWAGRWQPPRYPVIVAAKLVPCFSLILTFRRLFQAPWTGVYNATYDRPQCYQMMPPAAPLPQSEVRSAPGLCSSDRVSDRVVCARQDCLYLNVFTANLPGMVSESSGPVPVFFWLYGGSLIDGSVEVRTCVALSLLSPVASHDGG
jgi:carboxylesterase type B